MKNNPPVKKLKVRLVFNNNISEEEEDKLWFELFDILLNKKNEDARQGEK